MQLEDEERYLWIDSVCINQADHYEKSWQVGMMGMIYRRARAVLIQLGNLPKDSISIEDLAGCFRRVCDKVLVAFNYLPVNERLLWPSKGAFPSSWERNNVSTLR